MTAKLSIIIPCRNARHDLRACIESVRPIADEVLVADSGSTDGTLEVARSIDDCRVIEGEWLGYARFKNWAIPQAAHDWVLIVDADERATPQLCDEIVATLADVEDHIDGYWIRFRCFFLGHELRFSGYNSSAFRLFRRDRCRYAERTVHEEVQVPDHRAGHLEHSMLHYSIWTYDQYFQKWTKYTRLGSDELYAAGKRATLYSLSLRPCLRFFHLYFIRGGFRDGLLGLQICVLTAFFNTFVKQARLWERQHAIPQPKVGIDGLALPEDDSPPERKAA